jgi:sialidase-1
VLLFFNQNSTRAEKCSCGVWKTRSTDSGLTWDTPAPISPASGMVGSSLNSGITVQTGPHKGRLVMCMRMICKNSCPGPWESFSSFSDDHGMSWASSPKLAKGTTECQIAELSTGQLYLSSRPYKGVVPTSHRISALSSDAGSSWGPVKVEGSLTAAGGVDGSVISNPATGRVYFSHPDAGGRTNMTLYVSRDDALSWETTIDVYAGGSAYSDMAMIEAATMTHNGGGCDKVGLLFEKDQYKSVAFTAMQVC